MKMFWLVLILALLFVIGSASMMRYFDKVGARIPKLNSDYDPAVYKNSEEYEKRLQWGPFENRRPLEEDER